MEAAPDAPRVAGDSDDVGGRDRTEIHPVTDDDGGLGHFGPQADEADEQFQVEGETLEFGEIEGAKQEISADQLEAGLGIADGESKERFYQHEVAEAVDPADEWVADGAVGVQLAADDGIRIMGALQGKKEGDLLGWEFEVGIQEDDPVAACGPGALAQGLALARVVELDWADVRPFGRGAIKLGPGVIGTAIVYGNQLEGADAPQHVEGARDILADMVSLVVYGHDDREHNPG